MAPRTGGRNNKRAQQQSVAVGGNTTPTNLNKTEVSVASASSKMTTLDEGGSVEKEQTVKSGTVMSAPPVVKEAPKVELESDEEVKLYDHTNPTDVSIFNVMKLYVAQMAGNCAITQPKMLDNQANLWRTLKMVYESNRDDYYRRWNIIMYFLNKGSTKKGAFTGMLPFRGINHLPPHIKVPMNQLLGFLVPIANKATRGTAIHHLSIDAASQALPPEYRNNFLEYFGGLR